MTRSGKKRSTLELGHDAFLDIVANLVGILIILVVVLGSQSTKIVEQIQQEMDEQPDAASVTYASDQQLSELAQQSMRAASAQADSMRFEKRIKQFKQEIEVRKQQRGVLLDLLAQAEEAWAEKKQQLDEQQAALAENIAKRKAAENHLADLQGQRERLENEPEEIVELQHLPTPMAKTVFGEELHFRLKDNRLSIVPIDQLVDEIRRDLERAASGMKDGRMNSAVGPLRGYVARYQMDKSRQMVSQGGKVGMATRIQLVGMTVEPLEEPHGKPIDQILSNRRDLDIELAGRDPGSTTITIWVYPDSFAAFRKLKEHLYQRGYATAARPLTMDRLISGSPQGSRSDAQ